MSIVIDNLPIDLERRIRDLAQAEGMTPEDQVIKLVRDGLADKKERRSAALRALLATCGPMDDETYNILNEPRQIDPEMWK